MDSRPVFPVSPSSPPLRGTAGLPVVLAALALLCGVVATRAVALRPEPSTGSVTGAPDVASAAAPTDDELRRRIQGIWRLEDHGERIVENRPDGTATMIVRLNFAGALFYGSRLDFELTWSVVDGVLTHSIVSGTPKANVDKLVRDWGSSMSSRILGLDDRMLHLEETNASKDRYRWYRWPELR